MNTRLKTSIKGCLVGDVFQLPSVGPGSILSDLINAKRIKTFELKEIFRQSQESLIVINAHRIRRGEPPLFNTDNEATDPSQITRGKILVVLVGTQKALSIALKNDTPRKRNSALSHRLVWKDFREN